jgi:HSP20 family molecular chaperone IbpA
MHHKDFPDIQEILDQVFTAAEEIRHAVENEMGMGEGKHPFEHWADCRDYYPAYAYPPLNVFMTADKAMVFQFALAGFTEKDVTLEFRGDYMCFSATAPGDFAQNEDVRYFKRRLKLKSIAEQKYFVPASRFDQETTTAIMKNAILTVTIKAKTEANTGSSQKVNIVREDEKS